MPATVVVTWSLIDGRSVSPASSHRALAPKVKGVDAQKPKPEERAAVNEKVPWYGWPNWLIQNWASSSTQVLRRFRPIDSAETFAQLASPTQRFHPIMTRFEPTVSRRGRATPRRAALGDSSRGAGTGIAADGPSADLASASREPPSSRGSGPEGGVRGGSVSVASAAGVPPSSRGTGPVGV